MKLAQWIVVGAMLGTAACAPPTLDGAGSESSDPTGDKPSDRTLTSDGTELPHPTAATPLVAFMGGASIALRWSVIGQDASGVDHYDVYRNGTKVATVKPGFHAEFPEKDGKGYIDRDIERGASYEYRVQAFRDSGAGTDVGPSIKVTALTDFAPPPSVDIDSSQTPDLADIADSVKNFLQIWYPKAAAQVAGGDYAPPSAIHIVFDPSNTGIAGTDASAGHISVNPQFLRDARNTADLYGMFLHESTHILTSGRNGAAWVHEGIADWMREYVVHGREPKPITDNDHYTDGYSPASYFLNWIQESYNVPMLRALNVACHNGTYSRKLFAETTQKNLSELWEQLTGRNESEPSQFRFTSMGKCIDGGGDTARVATCNDSDDQQWTSEVRPANDGTLRFATANGRCLYTTGMAMGSEVKSGQCQGGSDQAWTPQPNGTLLNPQSGFCLDDPDGSTADGTHLRIWDCNGSPAQQFSVPR
jgi:hypothetical protein